MTAAGASRKPQRKNSKRIASRRYWLPARNAVFLGGDGLPHRRARRFAMTGLDGAERDGRRGEGSESSAAGGRRSEMSEWPRSKFQATAVRQRENFGHRNRVTPPYGCGTWGRCNVVRGVGDAAPYGSMVGGAVHVGGGTWVPPYRGISRGAVKRGVGEIGKAPPVAEEASRFRGSAPIGGHDSGRESVGTTVGKRRPLRGHGWGCGTGGRGRTPPLRGGWECGAGVLRIATPVTSVTGSQ